MKESKKYIVFRDRETGQFLTGYKSKGTLAFDAKFTEDIESAAMTSIEAFEDQKKQYKALAKSMKCEIVVVDAVFKLNYLNGEEVKVVERKEVKLPSLIDLIGSLFEEGAED